MPDITVHEDAEFESGIDAIDKSSRTRLRWFAFGSDDRAAVRALLLASYVPRPFYDGLRYRSLETKPIGPEHWEAIATYADKDSQAGDEPVQFGGGRFSFDTSGGTVHITHGLDERKTNIGAKSGPDQNAGINVRDGIPEGTDIIVPALRFQQTFKFPAAVVTESYIKTCANLTGTRNAASIFTFDPGELLLEGVSGSGSSDGDPELTFSFAADPDTEIEIAGETIQRKGHDYLWILSQGDADATTKRLKNDPLAVYLNELYPKKDWGPLKINPPPTPT